jgi:hypothetical protein
MRLWAVERWAVLIGAREPDRHAFPLRRLAARRRGMMDLAQQAATLQVKRLQP